MVLPIKKILCPTDFSEPSYEGLKAANELADYFSAKLIIVHVVSVVQMISAPLEPSGTIIPEVIREIEESVKKALDDMKREKITKGVKTSTMLLQGSSAVEIVRAAKDEHVDLIVIATHGQSGWKKLISGSVTERVVRLTDRPVLTTTRRLKIPSTLLGSA